MSAPIVIVGAGEAGVAAAEALRQGGFSGEIVLISEEHENPYQRPPLSKELLLHPDQPSPPIRPHDWYVQRGVELRLGVRVTEVDATGRTLSFDSARFVGQQRYSKLLIATGTRARRFNEATIIHYLRTRSDALAIRAALEGAERVAVIGGGVIGLELASAARQLGKQVTVFEISSRLMPRVFSPCVSKILEGLHRDAGVQLHFGIGSVKVDNDSVEVDGERIAADLFVAGIGALPNCDIGVAAGCVIDNGICVDDQGRTSIPDIFAAGDVANFVHPLSGRAVRIETWQHAQRHGAHVGRAMLDHQPAYAEVPWFWTDQHGVNFQVAGFMAQNTRTAWREREASDQKTAFHFAGDCLLAATTINNGRDMRPATKLISSSWRGDAARLCDTGFPLGPLANQLLADAPQNI